MISLFRFLSVDDYFADFHVFREVEDLFHGFIVPLITQSEAMGRLFCNFAGRPPDF